MPTSKQYRCYLVFREGTLLSPGKKRNGAIHWVRATNPESARLLVESKYLDKEKRRNEWHEKTVAAPRSEDVAMREQGQPGLFD